MQTAWRERKPQARIKAATDALEKNPEWVFDSNWTIKSWLFLRNNIIISFYKQGSQTECQQTYNSNYICTNSQRNPQKKCLHKVSVLFKETTFHANKNNWFNIGICDRIHKEKPYKDSYNHEAFGSLGKSALGFTYCILLIFNVAHSASVS